MFTNLLDIHYPLIGKGIIKSDQYTNDLDKTYYIQLLEVFESDESINRYFNNQTFETTKITELSRRNKLYVFKNHMLSDKSKFFEENLLKIDGFFVRLKYVDIFNLRKKYIGIIKDDINRQLGEINKLTDSLPNPISYKHK